MGGDVVISVENLGKRYRIAHQRDGKTGYQTFREMLTGRAKHLFRGQNGNPRLLSSSSDVPASRATHEDFWALKGVSFEVRRGDVLGIIGRNGAGKTTLLKILSRITDPTEGRVRIRGRVASLLEVGTGFHPELTGRENIYLNGAILGMSKTEIKKKFDEIVAFAETEKFLDTPVKRYSSGMYIRLAFAVAAHLEPEVLVVDEVLAVGDVQFQKKCLGKMSIVADEGRTILFVSHNMAAVRRLCRRAILLDSGRIAVEGDVENVINEYLRGNGDEQDRRKVWATKWNPPEFRDSFRVEEAQMLRTDGSTDTLFRMDEPIALALQYKVIQPFDQLRFSVHVRTADDDILVLASTDADTLSMFGLSRRPGRFVTRCWIPANLLSPRKYTIHFGAYLPNEQIVAGGENVATFEILETSGPVANKMKGVINPLLLWDTEDKTNG